MTSYAAADLLREAHSLGYRVSKRLIDDWVSLGLLDRPNRTGLGRGKGTASAWPQEQCDLFRYLLKKRKTVKRIAPLCNVPAWLWLVWGDGYVPLRQVRRALATWGQVASGSPWARARRRARRLLSQVVHPAARTNDRKRFVEVLSIMLYGRKFDEGEFSQVLQRVIDPLRTGQSLGPMAARLTPASLLTLFRGRYEALEKLDRLEDSHFESARLSYWITRRGYAALQPELARELEMGHLFKEIGPEEQVDSACLHLTTLLGLMSIPSSDGGRQQEDKMN